VAVSSSFTTVGAIGGTVLACRNDSPDQPNTRRTERDEQVREHSFHQLFGISAHCSHCYFDNLAQSNFDCLDDSFWTAVHLFGGRHQAKLGEAGVRLLSLAT
jgi:hypothetical protein